MFFTDLFLYFTAPMIGFLALFAGYATCQKQAAGDHREEDYIDQLAIIIGSLYCFFLVPFDVICVCMTIRWFGIARMHFDSIHWIPMMWFSWHMIALVIITVYQHHLWKNKTNTLVTL